MKERASNFLTLLAIVLLVQWALSTFFFHPPQPQGPAPHAVTLPPGLTISSPAARSSFSKSLGDLDAAAKSPASARDHLYDQAVNELQDVVKAAGNDLAESKDGLAASLEIAHIQWALHSNQRDNAAATLNNLILLRIDPSLRVPVQSDSDWHKPWTLAPAAAYAADEYEQVSRDIVRHNEGGIGFKFLDFIVKLCGFAGRDYSQAVALIVLGFLVTILLTPLRNWQYRTSAKMSRLMPQVQRIQQEFKGQTEEVYRRTQALYKENGTNQFMGCLPALMQWPVTLGLYYAVRAYQYKFTGKFLWIGSQFAIRHAAYRNLPYHTPKGPIFAVSLAHMDLPLLLLYTFSMYVSMKLMPVSGDQEQIRMSQRMGVMMSLMFPVMFYFGGWPSAFMLYWLSMNVAQMLVTYFYFRNHPDVRRLYTGGGNAAPVTLVASNGKKAAIVRESESPAPKTNAVKSSGGGGGTNGAGPASPKRVEPRNRRKMRGRRG